MFRISCANILTSIVAIVSIFGPTPIFAADVQPRTIEPQDIPTALEKQPLPKPKPEDVQINLPNISASQPEKKNIFQQAANGISKGASSAWNATSNFVSGIFKGDEPCSESADTALRGTDSNIEKTKLDTKQAGTDSKDGAAGKCVVAKCKKNYVPNDSKSGCEQSGGPCPEADIKKVAHATAGELKKGQCIITECTHGYHPSDNGTSCQQAELSEADSKQKVEDLEKNAQAMKDKEQSTANKLLGAASIGATGIGGMNLMEGMAQQNADDAAEEDMKAYLATFVCDYGQGRNIKGGEHDVSLPGGNDLFTIVNEYKALALDLKTRKEALGKQPGIESEIIIEAAETGLYDDVGMGRQSGAYASLSRALTDETGADAQAWAQQKADTASKVKTGAIVAGSGIVAGAIGNLAINSGEKNKNQADKIIADYDKKKQAVRTIQAKIDSMPDTPQSCSDYIYNNAPLTGTYPECNCGENAYFNPEHSENDKLVGCIKCIGDTTVNSDKTKCTCPNGIEPDTIGTCPTGSTPCNLSGDFVNQDICSCTGNARLKGTACICDGNNHTNANGNCVYCDPSTHTLNGNDCIPKAPKAQLQPIIIKSDKLFNISKATFKNSNLNFRSEFANDINKISEEQYNQYNICIEGQTDPSKFPRNSKKNNEDLSTARAYAVSHLLTNNTFKSVKYKGTGAVTEKDNSDNTNNICNPSQRSTWENCRRVLITISATECPTGYFDSDTEPEFYNLYK